MNGRDPNCVVVIILVVQPSMQKLEHQSFAISTGCYLAQMVHIIDYPVSGAAAVAAPLYAAALLLQSCSFCFDAAVIVLVLIA